MSDEQLPDHEEVMEGIPPLPEEPPAVSGTRIPAVAAEGADHDFARALAYVGAIPPAPKTERNNTLNAVSFRLLERFCLTEQQHLELCLRFAGSCTPPLPENEARRTARSAWDGCHRKGAVCGKRTGAHSPAIQVLPGVDDEEPIILTPNDLLGFDTTCDPNTFLGKRWLCRGGSCLVIGQTGLGKSSFGMQAAMTWAVGDPLFGIAPARPLKSLVIQAENDVGDLAEMFKGVLGGAGYNDRIGSLQERLVFVSETSRFGPSFHPWARQLVLAHKPDLVWLDPLFAYLGGSVSDQGLVSPFLRNGLGTIAKETGACWMIVHHTNKPPADPTLRKMMAASDYAYFGAGSAELANWARAILVVRALKDGVYELRAAKRGTRAGLLDLAERPATEIYLQHAQHRICWERAEAPEDERQSAEQEDVNDIMAAMTEGYAYDFDGIAELAARTLGVSAHSIKKRGRRCNRVLNLLLDQTRTVIGSRPFFRLPVRTARTTRDKPAVRLVPEDDENERIPFDNNELQSGQDLS